MSKVSSYPLKELKVIGTDEDLGQVESLALSNKLISNRDINGIKYKYLFFFLFTNNSSKYNSNEKRIISNICGLVVKSLLIIKKTSANIVITNDFLLSLDTKYDIL